MKKINILSTLLLAGFALSASFAQNAYGSSRLSRLNSFSQLNADTQINYVNNDIPRYSRMDKLLHGKAKGHIKESFIRDLKRNDPDFANKIEEIKVYESKHGARTWKPEAQKNDQNVAHSYEEMNKSLLSAVKHKVKSSDSQKKIQKRDLTNQLQIAKTENLGAQNQKNNNAQKDSLPLGFNQVEIDADKNINLGSHGDSRVKKIVAEQIAQSKKNINNNQNTKPSSILNILGCGAFCEASDKKLVNDIKKKQKKQNSDQTRQDIESNSEAQDQIKIEKTENSIQNSESPKDIRQNQEATDIQQVAQPEVLPQTVNHEIQKKDRHLDNKNHSCLSYFGCNDQGTGQSEKQKNHKISKNKNDSNLDNEEKEETGWFGNLFGKKTDKKDEINSVKSDVALSGGNDSEDKQNSSLKQKKKTFSSFQEGKNQEETDSEDENNKSTIKKVKIKKVKSECGDNKCDSSEEESSGDLTKSKKVKKKLNFNSENEENSCENCPPAEQQRFEKQEAHIWSNVLEALDKNPEHTEEILQGYKILVDRLRNGELRREDFPEEVYNSLFGEGKPPTKQEQEIISNRISMQATQNGDSSKKSVATISGINIDLSKFHENSLNTRTSEVALASGDENKRIIKGLWARGSLGKNKQSASKNSLGYKGSMRGFAIGADAEITERATLGVAYGKTYGYFKYSSGKSRADVNSLSLYGIYEVGKAISLEGALSYSFGDIKNARRIGNGAKVTSKIKTKHYSASTGVNYNLLLGKGFVLVPYAKIESIRLTV